MSRDALNITAILLNFVAFWCVTPELMGGARLSKWAPHMSRMVTTTAALGIVSALFAVLVPNAVESIGAGHVIEHSLRIDAITVGCAGILILSFWKGHDIVQALSDWEWLRLGLMYGGAILFTLSTSFQVWLAIPKK
jgi:hypothetical protein